MGVSLGELVGEGTGTAEGEIVHEESGKLLPISE
jgi:hypothetical protein